MSHQSGMNVSGFVCGNVIMNPDGSTTQIGLTKTQFFSRYGIKYLNVNIQLNDKGEKEIRTIIPTEWQFKSVDELRVYRDENNTTEQNCHMIRLDDSPFVVVDNDIIDEEKHQEFNSWVLDTFGGFMTKSRRGKTHIWLKKHEMDKCKNKITWKKIDDNNKVDLIYTTLFEPMTDRQTCMKPDLCGVFTDYVKDDDIDTELDVKENIKNSSLENQQIEMLEMIDAQYWSNYQSWVELILSIYKITGDYGICDEYSQRGDNYDSYEKVVKKIDSFKHNKFDGGTINHYAKLSDPVKYQQIIAKYFKIDEDIDDITDWDLGQKVIDLLSDNIVYDEDGCIYLYDETTKFWKCDNEKSLPYTQLAVMDTLDPICKKKLEKWKGKREKELAEDDLTEKKKWVSIRKKIGSRSGKENISNQIRLILERHKQDFQFDFVKPNYFSFKNITFDLNKRKPVNITKEDRITLFANHNYKKPTKKVKDEFEALFKTILPDEENRKCYLSVLRKGLYGELLEYFTILSGHGRNGKGFLNSLLNYLITDVFYYQADATLLTEKARGGTNPMVARMNKKRITICSEPSNDEKLQIDKVKNLTGNPILNARMIYSNKVKTINTNCLFCESNDMPEFNEAPTNAMYERFIKITFPNQFTKRKELVDDKTFFEAKDIKNIPTYEKYCFCFFDMIMNSEFDDVYIPPSVQQTTNELIRENDDIYNFIINTYQQLELSEEEKNRRIEENRVPVITLKDVIREYKQRVNRKVKVGLMKDKIMNNRELQRMGILSPNNPNMTDNSTPCLVWIQVRPFDL